MPRPWGDFRDRKVVQWAIGYLAAAWLLYEVLSQVGENFAWPPVILRVATVVLAVGFFVAVVLAWYHGEKGRQKVGAAELVLLGSLVALGAAGVRAVAIRAGPGPPPPPSRVSSARLLNSVAVLPLTNRSGPDREYFSDGLTEELMGALARVPGLRLAARTSSFAFKDHRLSLDSVAAALKVRHILDGSVLRRGDSVRVSVALIDARSGYELWNASYRRPLADIFVLEQEIARAVVDALPLDPILLERDWDFGSHTTDLEAYDLFLLGKEAWNRRTGADLLRAAELFEEATRLDPGYAPAWAALAETYMILPGYTSLSMRTAGHRLEEAASRALALDGTLAQAHAVLGYSMAWFGLDFPAGVARMQRALDLDPDYATALHWQGELLAHVGRFSEARANFELALEVDPLAPVIAADYGQALQLAGDYDEAITRLERLLTAEPGYLIGEYWLLYPLLLTGRYGRAEAVARSLAPKIGLDAEAMAVAVRALAGDAPREDALRALDAQPRAVPGVARTVLAALYGLLGALDGGFALLEAGLSQPFQGNVYLVTHPVFEPFRGDPRYAPLAAMVRVRDGGGPVAERTAAD